MRTTSAIAFGVGRGRTSIAQGILAKAEIFPGKRPDTVTALHGWWQGCDEMGMAGYPALEGGANTNHLYRVDPKKA